MSSLWVKRRGIRTTGNSLARERRSGTPSYGDLAQVRDFECVSRFVGGHEDSDHPGCEIRGAGSRP
ncbi:hypothetical protein SCOR_20950 [Sulfidibacter corallicola]